jgi:hypothetical protein
MMIYIDSDYKCYTAPADGLTAVEVEFFDGKCKAFIKGYRFVPSGSVWTRSDGVVFAGEMASPWKDYSVLAAAQAQYEETLAEMQDMHDALTTLGVELDG